MLQESKPTKKKPESVSDGNLVSHLSIQSTGTILRNTDKVKEPPDVIVALPIPDKVNPESHASSKRVHGTSLQNNRSGLEDKVHTSTYHSSQNLKFPSNAIQGNVSQTAESHAETCLPVKTKKKRQKRKKKECFSAVTEINQPQKQNPFSELSEPWNVLQTAESHVEACLTEKTEKRRTNERKCICCSDTTECKQPKKRSSSSEFSVLQSMTNKKNQNTPLGDSLTAAEPRELCDNPSIGSPKEGDLSTKIVINPIQRTNLKMYKRKVRANNLETRKTEDVNHSLSDAVTIDGRESALSLLEDKEGIKARNVKDEGILNVVHRAVSESGLSKVQKLEVSSKSSPVSENIVVETSDFGEDNVKVDSSCALVKENIDRSISKCRVEGKVPSVHAMNDDVSFAVQNKDNAFVISLVSPKRAPFSDTRRKLLVLDLNGILADIVIYVPYGYTPDKWISKKALFKRPFCDDFLRFCFERFQVGIWSSRTKRNVDIAVDFLMEEMKHKLLFCWDQSHCTHTGFTTVENVDKPLVLKELSKLWDKHVSGLPWGKGDYNETNTLLLDDSPYKALRNPPYTAIFPKSYTFRDVDDDSLGPGGALRVYLEGLAMAENVQKYVDEHPFGQRAITDKNPSWGYYRRVIANCTSYSRTRRW